MTDPTLTSDTRALEFREELEEVLITAHEDGLDLERHWAIHTHGDTPEWEVEIVRVSGDSESGEA